MRITVCFEEPRNEKLITLLKQARGDRAIIDRLCDEYGECQVTNALYHASKDNDWPQNIVILIGKIESRIGYINIFTRTAWNMYWMKLLEITDYGFQAAGRIPYRRRRKSSFAFFLTRKKLYKKTRPCHL